MARKQAEEWEENEEHGKMNSNEYIQNALKTESNDFEAITARLSDHKTIRILHAAKGLVTEAGEIEDALKKHVFYGKELDTVNLKEEMGDIFWYLAILADALGEQSFEAIMETNIAKLKARYGEKFTAEKAVKRNLDVERVILEA